MNTYRCNSKSKIFIPSLVATIRSHSEIDPIFRSGVIRRLSLTHALALQIPFRHQIDVLVVVVVVVVVVKVV